MPESSWRVFSSRCEVVSRKSYSGFECGAGRVGVSRMSAAADRPPCGEGRSWVFFVPTCQASKTVYNNSHCLHIQVTHVGPYTPSDSNPSADSKRHFRKRHAPHPRGNSPHARLQVTECGRGTLARLAAQRCDRPDSRRFSRHSTQRYFT